MTYKLVEISTDGERHDYHALRRSVLWEARGESGYDDNHPDDCHPANHNLLLIWNNHPIGTTRLDDLGNGTGAVRLVAIATDQQRQGHGRILTDKVDDFARTLGLHTLYVNAAPEALGFYEKLGWTRFSWDTEELTGIAADCVQMHKSISA